MKLRPQKARALPRAFPSPSHGLPMAFPTNLLPFRQGAQLSPCPPAKAMGRQSSGDKARLERENARVAKHLIPRMRQELPYRLGLATSPELRRPTAWHPPRERTHYRPEGNSLPGPLSRPASGAPGRELREQVGPDGWEWCILSREGTPEDRKRRVWGRVVRGKAEYRGESVRWGKCPLELENGNSRIGVGELGIGNGQWQWAMCKGGMCIAEKGKWEMGNGEWGSGQG